MSRNKKRNAYKELPIPRNTQFDNSLALNTNTYYFWFNRMCEIVLSLFKWENMPETVDLPTLEYGLLMNGNVCFFKDIVLGYLALMGAPSGKIDVYNYPSAYYIHTASGYNNHLAVSKFSMKRTGVVIYGNYMRTSPIIVIKDYALRLTEAMRSADVNINNQKTMNIILCNDSQRLSFENMMKNYDGNVPHMLADKNLIRDGEDFIVKRIEAPFVADKVWTYITNIWNDFLTWCGIENATNQKRERLVADEVNANYGNVEMERNTMLGARKIACDEINKLFGLDIDVKFNSSLNTALNIPFQMGDNEDGNLYDQDTRTGELLSGNVQQFDIQRKNSSSSAANN